MENRKRLIELLMAVRYTTNDIEKVADEICLLFSVVRSVFTIHSTENEGIIKIVGTEEEAKKEVEAFKKQHSYADFFYEKQNVS